MIETSVTRLNLGCGSDLRDGWINVDKHAAHPSVVQADLPVLPFESDYADEIVLSHVLEHFGYRDGLVLCREIHRVLKPGGRAEIEVPDIAWCMAQFLGAPEPKGYTEPAFDYNTEHRWGLFAQSMWGDQHHDGLFHKWGFTAHRLLYQLAHCGFRPVEIAYVHSHGVQCLRATAVKPERGV
ncbi:MAG TPA: methyltransferase domain-containing protein [Fimbriimonadaceae bacterium]|nr:methyltransferase domain-containing protein [Fimbriimonadaceae bacterium]